MHALEREQSHKGAAAKFGQRLKEGSKQARTVVGAVGMSARQGATGF